jgi:hypothetical protein
MNSQALRWERPRACLLAIPPIRGSGLGFYGLCPVPGSRALWRTWDQPDGGILNPTRACARNNLGRIVCLMSVHRIIGMILVGALFCATGSLGSSCALYCNTAPPSHSLCHMAGYHHDAHHAVANCQDCPRPGIRFSISDSSCRPIDQAQVLDKSPYRLTLSSPDWQAAGLYAVSEPASRGSQTNPAFNNPLAPRQSSISAPLMVSLRI